MPASTPNLQHDSRPSGPTLDLHTDAILLREGAADGRPAYRRGASSCPTFAPTSAPTLTPASTSTLTPTPTPTPTSIGISVATPTSAERSPFTIQKSAFRAAPPIITVGPSPAMQRVHLRQAAAAEAARAAQAGNMGQALAAAQGSRARGAARVWLVLGQRGGGARAALAWPVLAAFALGAAIAITAQFVGARGGELAAFAALVAGLRALVAAMNGKGRAEVRRSGRH